MKQWMMFALLAAGLMSGQAMASDGNILLHQCQALIRSTEGQGSDTYDTGHCMGIVAGVTDMLMLFQDKLPKPVCVPGDVTYGQGVRIVTKYLVDHPKELNQHDSVLALIAFYDAYPCK